MASLRLELLKNEISPFRGCVIKAIRAEIVEVLKSSTINGTRMRDIVNFIRNNSSFFQEWHNSATAKLFSPPKFENTKSAKGYWF